MSMDFLPSEKPLWARPTLAVKLWPSIVPSSGLAATGPPGSPDDEDELQPNASAPRAKVKTRASFMGNLQERKPHVDGPRAVVIQRSSTAGVRQTSLNARRFRCGRSS